MKNEVDVDVEMIADLINKEFSCWETCKASIAGLQSDFHSFLKERYEANVNFKYWFNFVFIIYPIGRDLTQSLRVGDREGHVSSIHRSLPLSFGYGKTNYSRWTSIFDENCMSIKEKFPLIYESFMKGGFVVCRSC